MAAHEEGRSCCDEIGWVVKAIDGPTGLVARVRDLESFINKLRGGFALLVFIGAVNVVTLIKLFIAK